jgi:hypothetical protein
MSESSEELIEIDKMSVDQLAGAVVLILGAIGSLLLVIWQSKCHCKVNLCYIFQCERRPPSEEEMKGLKDQAKKQNEKIKKTNKKADEILEKEEEILIEQKKPLSRQSSINISELQPEPEIEKLV